MATTAFARPLPNSNFYLNPPSDDYAYATRPAMPDTPPSSASPEGLSNKPNGWSQGASNMMSDNPNFQGHAQLHSAMKYRPIRPMRNPLSVPAALRGEARGPRGPESPPSSQPNSLEESHLETENNIDVVHAHAMQVPTINIPQEQERLLQAKYGDQEDLYRELSPLSRRELEHDLGNVTAEPPTTAHWKSDSSADVCRLCSIPFTLFLRRHHCRHCGELVCHAHSSRLIRLDQNAHFHPTGHMVRGCDTCYDDARTVRVLREIRTKRLAVSEAAENTGDREASGREAADAAGLGASPTDIRRPVRSVSNIAASWTGLLDWSTF